MRLTEAEWQIMNALWEGWPATAREIADRLPDSVNWAYTTIKTMLTRLAEKEAVEETKRGNVGIYEPILTRQNARRNALKSLANQAFDGAFGPLMHFLLEDQNLSDRQREQLLEALQQREKGGEQ
ncbi:MAG: BlaI/MecI/CopY family transcriptional regulator [Planctomycetes bacterium]|nr:BlaI/MecI/CopY family transcriptional regulator [Planctomycetota bacterium]